MTTNNAGLGITKDGKIVGKNPSRLTLDELINIGKPPIATLKAIRLFCTHQCKAGDWIASQDCAKVSCQLWAFRQGDGIYKRFDLNGYNNIVRSTDK